jgi:hypothetical protein
MSRFVKVCFIFGTSTFLFLIMLAGLAPSWLMRSKILLGLFRLSGIIAFLAILYLVGKLFFVGMKSAQRKVGRNTEKLTRY